MKDSFEKHRNWAGNYAYSAATLHRPQTVAELRVLVARSRKVKILGMRHSFNAIADTDGDLVSLEHLDRVLEIDRSRRVVTVEGGVRYGSLCRHLDREGFALRNLASLPHISVAGACATATHGSGDGNGNLATAVCAMEFVAADGSVVALSRDANGEQFRGAVVGLGAVGAITKLKLDIVPAYAVRQFVFENLPLEQIERHFDEITSSAYSVSFFTDWRTRAINQVWLKCAGADGGAFESAKDWFGASRATGDCHPIAGHSAENCTAQMGVIGPWHERLPHFRMEFTPSSGAELQSEYFVPRQHALAAFRAIGRLRSHIAPLLLVSEVRTIAADDLWMSPCHREASIGIHFTWKQDWPAVREVLPMIEAQLAPFGARPHWGKLFTMPPAQLQTLYEKLDHFRELLLRFDPQGRFRNAFIDSHIFSGA